MKLQNETKPTYFEQEEEEISEDESVYKQLSQFSELRKTYKNISSLSKNGKIITNEAEEAVVVESSTYSQMVKLYGGCWIVISINFVMLCFMLSAIYSNTVLLQWANQSFEEQQARFKYFLILTLSVSFATAFFVFCRVLLLICGNMRAIKVLHNSMLAKVLRAPINLFYDVTPIGKILNRFSKDLQVMD